MTTKTSLCALALTGLSAIPAYAGEITGGSVELSYSTFLDDADFSKLAHQGSLEYGFNRSFAIQGDLDFYNFNAISDSGTGATLHGIYDMNDQASFGLFYGQERLNSSNIDFAGAEFGYEFTALDAEFYFSAGDNNGASIDVFGASARHKLSPTTAISASFDNADFGGALELRTLAVKLDYGRSEQARGYVELGSVKASAFGLSGSEAYIGIGAKYNFGAQRGATFSNRGLLDFLPGL